MADVSMENFLLQYLMQMILKSNHRSVMNLEEIEESKK